MAEVMIGLALAKAAVDIGGARMSDKSQQAEAKYRASSERAEAENLEFRAGQERAVGQFKAQERQRETERLIAAQEARFAASGAGTGGSAATVMAKTAAKGNFNSDIELYQGNIAGNSLEYQAGLKRDTAGQILAADKQRRRTMPLVYAGQVISGISNAAAAGSGTYWGPGSGRKEPWQQITTDGNGQELARDTFGGKQYEFG